MVPSWKRRVRNQLYKPPWLRPLKRKTRNNQIFHNNSKNHPLKHVVATRADCPCSSTPGPSPVRPQILGIHGCFLQGFRLLLGTHFSQNNLRVRMKTQGLLCLSGLREWGRAIIPTEPWKGQGAGEETAGIMPGREGMPALTGSWYKDISSLQASPSALKQTHPTPWQHCSQPALGRIQGFQMWGWMTDWERRGGRREGKLPPAGKAHSCS